MDDRLYASFRNVNWWARHNNLLFLIPMIVVSLPLLYLHWFIDEASLSPHEHFELLKLLIVVAFGIFLASLVVMVAIKHFFHDRPFQKFKADFPEGERWTTNMGDMLKIYD